MDIVIPAAVLQDTRLEDSAKLLYGIIFVKAKRHGYCVPKNQELAWMLNLSKARISHLLSVLNHFGYIERAILTDSITNEILERRLYLTKQKWITDEEW